VIYDLSLIQISNAQKTYLFRVSKTGYTEELYRLMENPDIIKVGASLKDDYKKLFKHRTFDTSSFVDLQVFVKKFDIESMALKKIAAIVLGIRISKSQRLSNWDKEELSEGQIRYAATDAWVCREIYLKLLNQ
jgi:ribonuclease D